MRPLIWFEMCETKRKFGRLINCNSDEPCAVYIFFYIFLFKMKQKLKICEVRLNFLSDCAHNKMFVIAARLTNKLENDWTRHCFCVLILKYHENRTLFLKTCFLCYRKNLLKLERKLLICSIIQSRSNFGLFQDNCKTGLSENLLFMLS